MKRRDLGKAASAVARALRGMSESYEDIHAWGAPPECGRAVDAVAWREAKRGLHAAGYRSAREFLRDLERRTSGKWVWKSGFGWVMEDHRVRPLSNY